MKIRTGRTGTVNSSLKLNMVLNAVKGLMSVLFPLITFPYVSRVLGVENIGKYNFAHSIINYYVLMAGLGIAPYAIREGAKLRNDKKGFQRFADEMFSINVISTVTSTFLLIPLFFVSSLGKYRILMAIFSFQMVFKTVEIEWLFSVYENYAYITIRSILFQIISLVLMFLLVHRPEDVNVYAAVTVFSGVGSNVLNYLYASRFYCRVKLTGKIHWTRHLKPILIMFATTLAVTIYVSSDITILGFLCGEYRVGIYSVSTKVYTVLKTILSAVVAASLPRLSAALGNKDKQTFCAVAADVYRTLMTFVLPAATGIILMRHQVILLISNEDYMEAESSLTILAVAIVFCMCACYWSQCILVPLMKEKKVFYVTVVSAILNIVLNFIFIPRYSEKAAAGSTMIAEALVFLVCYMEGKKDAGTMIDMKFLLKVGLGCGFIVAVSVLIQNIVHGTSTILFLCIGISVVGYLVIEMLLKNEVVVDLFNKIKRRLH